MRYTVQTFGKTDFVDQYGNVGYNVKFQEEAETAFWLTKKDLSEGMEVEGEIKDVEKKNKPGETYRRFFTQQPQQTDTEIHRKLDRILELLEDKSSVDTSSPVDPDDDIDLSDVPF